MTNTREEEVQKKRKACIKNAEDFIKAARIIKGKDLNHIHYHLATLALEEIGKAGMIGIKFIIDSYQEPKEEFNINMEDHVKKLFWALWGPSFGREKITNIQIESYRNLAKTIHERRLLSLYVDPYLPILPKDKITEEETNRLVELADIRIKYEKTRKIAKLNQQEADNLKWFLVVTDDLEKRKLIFGNKSLKKLAELKDTKSWIRWLKTTFERNEKKVREILEEELKRAKPSRRGAKEDKWRVKIRIHCESHSIRPRVLYEWNKRFPSWIRLYPTNKRDEMICQFMLLKSVPLAALWRISLNVSRVFIMALNIATRGHFWWHVPKETSRFYEEIWDVERNAGVRPQLAKRLRVGWEKAHLTLTPEDLSRTALVFSYLTEMRKEKINKALTSYANGLALLSKSDIHLQFELNAFEEFYKALRNALLISKVWDGKESIILVAKKQFKNILKDTKELGKYITWGEQFLKKEKISNKITLTEVVGMKLYCDLYFLKLANEWVLKKKKKK